MKRTEFTELKLRILRELLNELKFAIEDDNEELSQLIFELIETLKKARAKELTSFLTTLTELARERKELMNLLIRISEQLNDF